MAGGWNQAQQQAVLDLRFPTSGAAHWVGYSLNGTTESAATMARTAIGATGWAAATAATPSVKANNTALTTAAAGGSGSISHVALFDASTGGNQLTDWQSIGTAQPVIAGNQLTWPIGSIQFTLD